MSCVEYESVELVDPASQKANEPKTPMLSIVPRRSQRYQGDVVRRVAEILDFELPRGLMPS